MVFTYNFIILVVFFQLNELIFFNLDKLEDCVTNIEPELI